MEYTNSTLIDGVMLSPNYTKGRTTINRITPHHTASGAINAKRIAEIFAPTSRGASCNYGIGDDGSCYLICEEKNRSWCSSNKTNDMSAITFEVSDHAYGEPWAISDRAYNKLVDMCVDICHRYGKKGVFNIQEEIEKIPQSQRASFANNYPVPDDMILLTQHNYFSSTACPGTWLKNNWQKLTDDINAKLGGYVPPVPTPVVSDPIAKPVLKKGAKGDEVVKLQKNLNEFGYLLAVDGDFGSGTDRALRGWQKATGLVSDGSYGPASYAKMQSLLNR